MTAQVLISKYDQNRDTAVSLISPIKRSFIDISCVIHSRISIPVWGNITSLPIMFRQNSCKSRTADRPKFVSFYFYGSRFSEVFFGITPFKTINLLVKNGQYVFIRVEWRLCNYWSLIKLKLFLLLQQPVNGGVRRFFGGFYKLFSTVSLPFQLDNFAIYSDVFTVSFLSQIRHFADSGIGLNARPGDFGSCINGGTGREQSSDSINDRRAFDRIVGIRQIAIKGGWLLFGVFGSAPLLWVAIWHRRWTGWLGWFARAAFAFLAAGLIFQGVFAFLGN